MTIAVTLDLPEDLVARAQAAGLLDAQQVIAWLEAELDRKTRVDRLFTNIDRLHDLQPPLSQAEIDAELEADRREQRGE